MLVPNNGSELFSFFYNNDIYVVSSCQIALNSLCFLTLEFKHIYFLRRGICIVTKGRLVSIRSSMESNIRSKVIYMHFVSAAATVRWELTKTTEQTTLEPNKATKTGRSTRQKCIVCTFEY